MAAVRSYVVAASTGTTTRINDYTVETFVEGDGGRSANITAPGDLPHPTIIGHPRTIIDLTQMMQTILESRRLREAATPLTATSYTLIILSNVSSPARWVVFVVVLAQLHINTAATRQGAASLCCTEYQDYEMLRQRYNINKTLAQKGRNPTRISQPSTRSRQTVGKGLNFKGSCATFDLPLGIYVGIWVREWKSLRTAWKLAEHLLQARTLERMGISPRQKN